MGNNKYPSSIIIPIVKIVFLFFGFQGCKDDEVERVDCSFSNLLLLVESSHPTGCNINDGSIHVQAFGGTPPYLFRLNTGVYVSDTAFLGLGAGEYTVWVIDSQGCEQHLEVSLTFQSSLSASILSQTANSSCLAPYNGEVTVSAVGGSGTYQYAIGNGTFGSSPTFGGLRDGMHTITVKDVADNCTFSLIVTIERLPTGISFETHIRPIFQSKCQLTGCHPNNGDLLTYISAFNRSQSIKSRTQSGDMPRGGITLTEDEKALIACWVDDGAPQN
jgi:hypothetical protein